MHRPAADIGGTAAAGYESVADAFASIRLGDGGAACCVYVDGESVVDVWAGREQPDRAWSHDTRAALFSATKALAAATAMRLARRGLLDPDAPVARYWPEFAANGKGSVLVRHVLGHTAGVLTFAGQSELLDWDGRGWDQTDEIARRIAAAPLAWEPGTGHGYHALTFGWMVGELVRRTDGRTLGAVLQEDIAAPLEADVRIGTPPELFGRIARVYPAPVPTTGRAAQAWRAWQDPSTLAGQAFLAGPNGSLMSRAADFPGSQRYMAAEVASGNGSGTARGVARVCAALADEVPELWRTEQCNGPDAVLGIPTRWGLGFELPVAGMPPGAVTPLATSRDAFGHGGFGGQLALADPTRRVGLGFVRSHLEGGWPSAAAIVAALSALH